MLKTLFRALLLLWGSFCLLLGLRVFAAENPVLVYLASAGQSSDIFAYDTVAHLRHNLSNSPYPEWTLSWSESGLMAFTASANYGETDALFLSQNFAAPQRFESLRNQLLLDLSLSPNGEYMLYISSEPANYSEIYLVNLDLDEIINLTATPNLSELKPQWFGDDALLFLRDGKLYYRPLNAEPSLLIDSLNILDYALSPDRQQIAMHSLNAGIAELYLAHSDGTGLRHIPLPLALSNEALSWSPDSQSLAFTLADGSLAIYQQQGLIQYPSAGRRISPLFSPDGNVIVYMEERHLYLLDWQNGAIFPLDETEQIRPPLFWMP